MSLNQLIELALPLIVSTVTSMLKQDHLADQWNALIAIAMVILASIGTAFLGGHLTGNVSVDILTVAGACIALQTVPWATPLFDWLQTHTPIAKPSIPATVQPIVQPSVVPSVLPVPPVIDQTNTSAAKPAN